MFESVTVREIYTDLYEISWKLLPGTSTSYAAFIVERSESYSGPFEEISEPLVVSASGFSVTSHLDGTFNNLNRQRTLYYRVKLVDWRTNLELSVSPVEHSRFDRDFIAMEIARRHNLLLRRFVGIPAFVFIAKTYGQRCSCWDTIKMRKTRSTCDECYNTGFYGGFMTPIPLFMVDELDAKTVKIAEFGEVNSVDGNGWTGHFPILKSRDILITQEDRYRVVDIKPIKQKKSVVMQIFTISTLSKSDVEWKIERPDFDSFEENDQVIRVYGGSSGDYNSGTHVKGQKEYSGYDPTTERGTLRVDGRDFDTEIGA